MLIRHEQQQVGATAGVLGRAGTESESIFDQVPPGNWWLAAVETLAATNQDNKKGLVVG